VSAFVRPDRDLLNSVGWVLLGLAHGQITSS